MLALRVLGVLAGLAIALATVLSAVRSTVLPRGVPARIARGVFLAVQAGFRLRLWRTADYALRDRVFANYAPYTLLLLLQVWLAGVYAGFALAFWAAAPGRGLPDALKSSGSALTTLGFDVPSGALPSALSFAESATGLLLVALLISYLPAIYSAFNRREALVTKLEVRAGSPPTGVELLTRQWRIGRLDSLETAWLELETWFVDIAETHVSFPSLVFFRSPQPDHSWVTGGAAALDAAALLLSSVDRRRDEETGAPLVEAQLCLRAGYLSLRQIASFFRLPYPPEPQRGDPISILREEWERAVDDLAAAGLPVVADRDSAWLDFAGWRVNYDYCVLALARLTLAPYAPWSSDRSVTDVRGTGVQGSGLQGLRTLGLLHRLKPFSRASRRKRGADAGPRAGVDARPEG